MSGHDGPRTRSKRGRENNANIETKSLEDLVEEVITHRKELLAMLDAEWKKIESTKIGAPAELKHLRAEFMKRFEEMKKNLERDTECYKWMLNFFKRLNSGEYGEDARQSPTPSS